MPSFILNPLVPPDSGESATQGASRIRNLTAALLEFLGETGAASVAFATSPISALDHATGQLTLAANLLLAADPTSNLMAATKHYVDAVTQAVPGNFNVKNPPFNAVGNGAFLRQ